MDLSVKGLATRVAIYRSDLTCSGQLISGGRYIQWLAHTVMEGVLCGLRQSGEATAQPEQREGKL